MNEKIEKILSNLKDGLKVIFDDDVGIYHIQEFRKDSTMDDKEWRLTDSDYIIRLDGEMLKINTLGEMTNPYCVPKYEIEGMANKNIFKEYEEDESVDAQSDYE